MEKRNNELLVIAIDSYKSGEFEPLNNAIHDAKALAEVLVDRYSFELCPESLFNEQATKQNIYDSFHNLVARLDDTDNLVIFFAGHGWQHSLTNKGYWIPYGASKSIADYVSNSEIKDFIESIRAKHIFLIADACFSGTFLTRTRGVPYERSYEVLDSQTSRWMLASGSEEPVSDGAKGQSSPFMRFLLRFLSTNENKYASVREMIRYVSTLTAQNSRQRPMGAHLEKVGHQDGEMVFVLRESWVKTHHGKTKGDPQTVVLAQEIHAIYGRRHKLSGGKEIVLIDSLVTPGELVLLELFRFDDQGNKKVRFQDDKLIMPAKDGEKIEWRVWQRFATWQGFTRYWDSKKEQYLDRKIIVAHAAQEIERVEETARPIYQQQILQDLYDAHEEPMRCLHCGQMISSNGSYLVEIDEIGLQPNAGNIHTTCLRKVDRILGETRYAELKEKENLVNFDHAKWIALMETCQGLVWEAKRQAQQRKTSVIAWNREHSFNDGEYCIRANLSDASVEYIKLGKKIHRFSAAKIEEELTFFKEHIVTVGREGDSWAYTSEKRVFGTVTMLQRIKSPAEAILDIISVEKVKYSQQMETQERIDNDYTPLGLLIHLDSKEIINFGNCIPLISDPTQFEILHANWNKAGYTIGPCALRIIESDQQLDLYLAGFFQDGMQPIIDPEFDENNEIFSGVYISDIRNLTEDHEEHNYPSSPNPKWKAGDRVKVVFPDVRTDKYASGVVVMDEFIDESGEPFIVFSPIEDGIQRQDLTFVMPSRLLVKA